MGKEEEVLSLKLPGQKRAWQDEGKDPWENIHRGSHPGADPKSERDFYPSQMP